MASILDNMTSTVSLDSLQKKPAIVKLESTALFPDDEDFTCYGELLESCGADFKLDGRQTGDLGFHSVGRLKAEIDKELGDEEGATVRMVFAGLWRDHGGDIRVRLTAGYVCEKGLVSEEKMKVGGEFMVVIEIADWRLVAWESWPLEREGGRFLNPETDLVEIYEGLFKALGRRRG